MSKGCKGKGKHLNVINTHFIKFFKNLSIQYDLIPSVPVEFNPYRSAMNCYIWNNESGVRIPEFFGIVNNYFYYENVFMLKMR